MKDTAEKTQHEPMDDEERTGSAHESAAPESEHDTIELDNTEDAEEPKPAHAGAAKPPVHKSVWNWLWCHKKVSIPAAVVLVLAVLAAVPATRYAIAGTFWKENFSVIVLDSQTNKPVTSATVQLRGKTAQTDSSGKATLRVPVGSAQLTVSKAYYRTASKSVTVTLGKPAPFSLQVVATGRQVPISVVNKITGKAVSKAAVLAVNTQVLTDDKGEAVIVLPADKTTVNASVKLSGYNTAAITIKVTTGTDPANTFSLTPSGKLYFLSNQSGKIDVVKTDLDGQHRQTVLAGTGNEVGNDTLLLASRDWKYLALKSLRDSGGKAKLYLIDTSTDKLSTIDEGDASFTPVGWSDHYFTFLVSRNELSLRQTGQTALKSFNAETGQLSVLDQTQAEDNPSYPIAYVYQRFSYINILNNQLVYDVQWYVNGSQNLLGKMDSIRGIQPNGQNKKDYKTFDAYAVNYIVASLYEPQGIYYAVNNSNGSPTSYWKYEDGNVTALDNTTGEAQFDKSYSLFLLSPSGSQTFWSEQRDGKQALFLGDDNAKNPQQIATLTDYTPYGWYGSYLLMSKNSSELYIAPAADWSKGAGAQKVSDYYKPDYPFNGYGYGYGGR